MLKILYFKRIPIKQQKNKTRITPKYPISFNQVIKTKKNPLMHAVKYGTIIYLQKELELLMKMYI